ncbi:MAG: DegT/DnrJ/EryC1/StrS family aminotransferase, partial [Candidatus Omnitrophica bacterium]|nr:DegT/DnrJ/EryC1/StrS family aminotransferase [Candidatus Omnitrophota bacterium]
KKTKAIIPVHLYGQAADMEPIRAIAKKYNLKVIEDAAQAHGAKYRGSDGQWKITGSMGDIACFSFYPTKNLGAFGDGGAVVTDSEEVHKKLLMLRDYGRKSRYEHVSLGYNSRLDTVQAAILRLKLNNLDRWNAMRNKNADIYTRRFREMEGVTVPYVADYAQHVYHIYAIRVKDRDAVVSALAKEGIGVLVHYPIPLHLQEVYKNLEYKSGDFPVAEKLSAEVISLPMYPHLKEEQIISVTNVLKRIIKG